MNIQCYSLNRIGGRKNLEDAVVPENYRPGSPAVFLLCDGVGGNSNGEIASALAANCFYSVLEKDYKNLQIRFRHLLVTALNFFQSELNLFIAQHPEAENASTTLTAMAILNDRAYLAWCGDSRIYHLRNGNILYKTQDHSLVAQLIANKEITQLEALSHPQKNLITRSLGKETHSDDIDTEVLKINSGDWLLSCSDGLLEQFTEEKFAIFSDTHIQPQNYSKLIDEICIGKTRDNYSMQLVHITKNNKSVVSNKAWWLISAILLLLCLWFGYKFYTRKSTYRIPSGNVKSNQTPVADSSKVNTITRDKNSHAIIPIIKKQNKSSSVKKPGT